MRKLTSIIQITVMSMLAMFVSVSLVSSAVKVDTAALREAVTVDGVRDHQDVFQSIANANGGMRASGTLGYDESAAYVADLMEDAGYDVTIQPFTFPFFEEQEPAVLEQIAPTPQSIRILMTPGLPRWSTQVAATLRLLRRV